MTESSRLRRIERRQPLRPLQLYGQVAIVTGAAKGMGKPICSMLVQEGAHVVLAGRISMLSRSMPRR